MTRWMILLLALAAACGSAPSGDPSPAGTGDRIAAIEAAREAVGQPAVALGSAALTIGQRADDLEAAPQVEAGPIRQSLADAADALADAAADAAGVELDPGVADVAEAAAALGRAVEAANESAAAAHAVVDVLARATEVDDQLDQLVAKWAEPGSRREQLDRLAEVADEADGLADQLEMEADGQPCAHVLDVRVEAARSVAAGSRELRELVAAYRGNEYDERRPELSADPFGLGTTLYEAVRADGICPGLDVAREEARDVVSALDDVQAALDPPDL